jgi:hypothetical protein
MGTTSRKFEDKCVPEISYEIYTSQGVCIREGTAGKNTLVQLHLAGQPSEKQGKDTASRLFKEE